MRTPRSSESEPGSVTVAAQQLRSVPPAAYEPTKRDETDERDDDSEHDAPEERHHDSHDHEDAADRDPANFAISHADCPPQLDAAASAAAPVELTPQSRLGYFFTPRGTHVAPDHAECAGSPSTGTGRAGQSFVSDPEVPPIVKEAGHKGKPQAAQLARSIDA
jgi:hypothetical protein